MNLPFKKFCAFLLDLYIFELSILIGEDERKKLAVGDEGDSHWEGWFSPPSLCVLPCAPLKFWAVFLFASCEHSMRMFIRLTLLYTWRTLPDTVVPSSFSQRVPGARSLWLVASQGPGWQALFRKWGCILPFQGACCDWVHFRLHLQPKTLDWKRMQRN